MSPGLPPFDAEGLLPAGIHEGTFDEILERCGFNRQRVELLEKLNEYLRELAQWPLAQAVLIDGSFATSHLEPNDIDVIVVLRDDYDLTQPVSPFAYNLRSRRSVLRRFGLDLFVVRPNSPELAGFVEFFGKIRGREDRSKGIIKVRP